ncbi:FimB/Mfa2 family fimbrial subunit [Chitinophaga sp. ARDCPP14]|uniref:FimB/Mfa2 family fimbrial subunit n=1 Tax=Chitinophaga sp. ARDCPP14 TaxID=3391139 RepID=UPI003F5288DA
MKKKWLIALSLSVLFYACSKDNTNERPDTRQVQIPFKVSVAEFIKKVQQLPSASGRMAPSSIFAKDSTLNTAVSDIYFFAFKNNGDRISYIHQRSTDADFGVISDSLPSGECTIALIASSDSLIISDELRNAGINLNADYNNNTILAAFPDIFYKKMQITVGPDTTANNFSLSLERIMASLEVNITDAPAIRADSNITVNVRSENTYFEIFSAWAYTGIPMQLKIPQRTQHLFSELIMNTSEEIRIDINYPDKVTNTMLTKTIGPITLTKNTKTILTGSLYPAIPPVTNVNSGFSVSINSIWNPAQTIDF